MRTRDGVEADNETSRNTNEQTVPTPPKLTLTNITNSSALSPATSTQEATIKPKKPSVHREQLVILGICLGIPVLSFLTVNIVVKYTQFRAKADLIEVSPQQFDEGSAPKIMTQYFIPKPVSDPGFLQRWLFGADYNAPFALNADLALRAGLLVALCAMCWWIPSLNWLTEQGWSLHYAITVFAFTFAMDVGSTMKYASHTCIGTFVAICNGLFMFSWYPDGVTENKADSASTFALAHFIIVTIIYVTLNWPMLMRMFAMYLQCYFTMCFLNPNSKVHFAHNLYDIAMRDGLVAPLVGTIIGCTISVALSIFPHPLSSFASAQDLAMETSWEMGRLWEEMVAYHTGGRKTLEASALSAEADRLYARIGSLEARARTCWWECFDLGHLGRVRAHIFRLCRSFGYLTDWLHGGASALGHENFDKSHVELMNALRKDLSALSNRSWAILHDATRAAVSGEMSTQDEKRLREGLEALNAAQDTLSTAFARARRRIYGHNGLAHDATGEHLFIFAINSYSRCVTEYALYLLEAIPLREDAPSSLSGGRRFWQRTEEGTSIIQALSGGIRDCVDRKVLFSWDHLRQSARITLAYLAAFFIGLNGIRNILGDYTSSLPSTTVFLLAFDGLGGAAFVKKFVRFQGMAVGTVVGQLMFAMLVRCTVSGIVTGALAVLVFEFFAFYCHFSSESFSYTGLLMATFAADQMLSGCNKLQDSPWEVYQTLLDQVVAIVCVIVSDFLLAPPSPSRLAVQAYGEASAVAHIAMAELLLPEKTGTFSLHRNELFSRLDVAEARGAEARLEPRFIRTPWREELWQPIVRHGFRLAQKLVLMEYIAAELVSLDGNGETREGGGFDEQVTSRRSSIISLLQSPVLQAAGNLFLTRREEVLALAQAIMLHDTTAPFTMRDKNFVQRVSEWRKMSAAMDIQRIVCDILDNADDTDSPSSNAPSAPEDAASPASLPEFDLPYNLHADCSPMKESSAKSAYLCEIGSFLHMLELSAYDLDAIANAIIRAPEISIPAMASAIKNPPKAGIVLGVADKLDSAMQRSQGSVRLLMTMAASSFPRAFRQASKLNPR